jgi:hypothetical protein
LDQILPTPPCPTTPSFEHHSKFEHSESKEDDMVGNQNVILAWMYHGALNLPELMHDLHKHLKIFLTKFDMDKVCSPKDHIKNFYLEIRLLDVWHEDVAYRILVYTFESKASTWYYNILVGSITI